MSRPFPARGRCVCAPQSSLTWPPGWKTREGATTIQERYADTRGGMSKHSPCVEHPHGHSGFQPASDWGHSQCCRQPCRQAEYLILFVYATSMNTGRSSRQISSDIVLTVYLPASSTPTALIVILKSGATAST